MTPNELDRHPNLIDNYQFMTPKRTKKDYRGTINDWVERNLTQEAATGNLDRAFEVDGIIDQLTESILAGRNPIVTGESGIGKTSVIHELVHRMESGKTLTNLKGKDVLQYDQIGLIRYAQTFWSISFCRSNRGGENPSGSILGRSTIWQPREDNQVKYGGLSREGTCASDFRRSG